MEQLLLGASLKSRDNFLLIKDYVVPSKYSREFQVLFGKVDEYYRRDEEVQTVDGELLIAFLQETIKSDKHVENFKNLIHEALSLEDIPEQNIKALVLQAKQSERRDELVVALANNAPNAQALAKEFLDLCETANLDDLNNVELDNEDDDVDLETLLAEEFNPAGALRLFPAPLNERVGGVRGGHKITIFGRPEAGKSLTALNAGCGFARQGAYGLYLGNEDRRRSFVLRIICNLSGMTQVEVERNPKAAIAAAKANGLDKIKIFSMTPGSLDLIEKLVKKHLTEDVAESGLPGWIVVDQLRNLNVKNESRVNQLDMAAQGLRNIAKKYNIIVIDVTQAGDSGEGKAILDMGDIDYSNTGVPAAADVLIGVGVNPALEAEGRRWLNLPKNKITGRHENFPVRINKALSQLTAV